LGDSPGFAAHQEPWLSPKRLINSTIPLKVDAIVQALAGHDELSEPF
jgi:hypothetical protein